MAAAAHGALVALMVLSPPRTSVTLPAERITVTLSKEIGLTSTSPEPMAAAAPDEAPEPDEPPAPEPEDLPSPPKPLPKPAAKPSPRPVAAPSPRPAPVRPAPTRPGGSKIGDDFLKGVPGATSAGTSRNPPAATAGPQVRASLAQAFLRQVRPYWQGRVPQGVNTEKLVTILSVELNPDGTLSGNPTMIRQEGVDDSNRQQAARHAEEAIRAVQLAAPFDLPPELYDAWRKLPPLRFRKSI